MILRKRYDTAKAIAFSTINDGPDPPQQQCTHCDRLKTPSGDELGRLGVGLDHILDDRAGRKDSHGGLPAAQGGGFPCESYFLQFLAGFTDHSTIVVPFDPDRPTEPSRPVAFLEKKSRQHGRRPSETALIQAHFVLVYLQYGFSGPAEAMDPLFLMLLPLSRRNPPTAPTSRPQSRFHVMFRVRVAGDTQSDMAVPTISTVTKTRDRLKGSGTDKSEWVTSFRYQLKVLLERQSRQSRGEVREHSKAGNGGCRFCWRCLFWVCARVYVGRGGICDTRGFGLNGVHDITPPGGCVPALRGVGKGWSGGSADCDSRRGSSRGRFYLVGDVLVMEFQQIGGRCHASSTLQVRR